MASTFYQGRLSSSTGAIVWGTASAAIMGLTVTKNMSVNALAQGSARMGVYADLGADWHQEWLLWLAIETGTANTAGNAAHAYMAETFDTTYWPGKVDGTDAAYPTTVVDNLKMLGPPITSLIVNADANTVLIQNPVLYVPAARYIAPVIYNNMGNAIRNEGTASNNNSGIVLIAAKNYFSDTEP